MFIGEYHHSIDNKGRIAIPIRFRKSFENGAVITRGLDGCLFLYARKEWEVEATKIAGLPKARADNRAFARHMLSGAMDFELDKQGRVVLPDYLRKFANISKKAVIAGLYNRVEMWDAALWEEYKKKTEKESNAIAERMGEMGI